MPSLLRQRKLKPKPPTMRLPIRLLRRTSLPMRMLHSLSLRRLVYRLLRLWTALHQLLQRLKICLAAEARVEVVEVDGVEEVAVSRRASRTNNNNGNSKQVRRDRKWTTTASRSWASLPLPSMALFPLEDEVGERHTPEDVVVSNLDSCGYRTGLMNLVSPRWPPPCC